MNAVAIICEMNLDWPRWSSPSRRCVLMKMATGTESTLDAATIESHRVALGVCARCVWAPAGVVEITIEKMPNVRREADVVMVEREACVDRLGVR
jgi:hypothetical protein